MKNGTPIAIGILIKNKKILNSIVKIPISFKGYSIPKV